MTAIASTSLVTYAFRRPLVHIALVQRVTHVRRRERQLPAGADARALRLPVPRSRQPMTERVEHLALPHLVIR